jgi:tRNA 2-thiouridine synthesizing protein A
MERSPDDAIDLRGTPCPLNWVKAKLRLEAMQPGQRLEMILDDGDPVRNVPRSVRAEGHRVVQVTAAGECVHVVVERG